jgi:hypothetical protein
MGRAVSMNEYYDGTGCGASRGACTDPIELVDRRSMSIFSTSVHSAAILSAALPLR